jgi:nitrate reductase NapE component
MSNFMANYFGPLDKNACIYFLIITIIFFVFLVIAIIGEVAFLVRNFNKLNFRTVTNGLLMLFNIWLAYFVNRLLLTMCYKSLA